MNYSIKTFTIVNLLISVCSVVFITIVIHLMIEHDRFSAFLDNQLKHTNQTISATLADHLTIEAVDALSKHMTTHYNQIKDADYHVEYIVWNELNIPIIRTPQAPFMTHPSADKQGFSNVELGKRYWRIYHSNKPGSNIAITSMYLMQSRVQLEKNVTRNGVLVMLMALPFFALIIWFIIQRGLSSISLTTSEVANREPNHLEPIPQRDVPYEILPLIQQLNILFVQLKNALIREKQFAGNAAHELRTPLAAIKMHVHAAIHDCQDERTLASLNKVMLGVDRSQHQINQLLTLSSMIPDSLSTDTQLVDISGSVTEVIEHSINDALERNILINFDTQTNARARGYPDAIFILFSNIISNAIKYSPNDSDILIKIFEADCNIVCEIIDEGSGLSSTEMNHVFDRFYRATGLTQAGTGLGLNIVKQIIDLHHANINLINRSDRSGLIVQVTIAKADDDLG
ncbi:MAG: hypothetical protein CMF46_01700 [Legionellales bacterium]|nr:hypothetical protein [Legionellales bacterium]